MHNIHQDFEINRSTHNSEIADMNLKVGKMQDICNQSLDYIDEVKDSQEKIATIVTCLLEFSSIEQALSFQDEIDRQRGVFTHSPSKKEGSLGRMTSKKGSIKNGDIASPSVKEDSIIGGQQSFELLSHKASKEATLSID